MATVIGVVIYPQRKFIIVNGQWPIDKGQLAIGKEQLATFFRTQYCRFPILQPAIIDALPVVHCPLLIVYCLLTYLWSMQKNIIHTTLAPAPIGPYSQAVQAGNLLFISGQVAMNPATGNIEATDVAGETEQVMKNLSALLTEAGYDFSHVVKTTIFLSDMSLFTAVNEAYGKYFTDNYPARETVAVKGLPRNVNVEISMIAAK
jgi:2-iminobutanoate/2-iminopropanoate deaminase